MTRLATLVLTALLVFAGPQLARAEETPRAAAERIIRAQMQAFQADDAGTAFSFASPDLQVKFGSPANFMEMVRTGYAPVYRPQAVEFRDLVDTPRGPDQQVFVIGPDGKGYIAHYIMQQQPDGSWRISGCYLEPLREESV
ncbi:uncharacterized protein DUF4864 [Dongia mobilis]|uniref:Uncharacterized protein DUF4864 n=1 Tax=Dongia mobilis TaxID=578943 RepID=A0A4R6X265_9PROT|nr:DUF4864 domain-containing protein [Dongia mobilis]TDQ84568.1 uncharacterized protein DUF4864 [Dongia mobilis]